VKIRAVVFDISGVLEVAPQRIEVSGQWEALLGLPRGEINRRMDRIWTDGTIGAITEADVRRSLGELVGLSEAQVEEYMETMWTAYLGTLNTELAAYFGALRPRYRTGILSNSFVGAREREQERYGFGDLADHLVYSHEAGMRKPDPDIYRLVCEHLAVPPEETVFLDDFEPYAEGAREAGMHAVLFKDTEQAIADIEALLSR
jgi:putative hydrolase of the HAD superfamily